MPIYQYKCSKCSCEFETKKSFAENPDASCPECGKRARRIFSPTAVIFKGPGFYCTDSRANACLASGNGGKDKTEAGKEVAPKVGIETAKPKEKKIKNDESKK